MTAAFELSRPEHRGRYQVTVYQMGFRLGGKGASGRGVAGRIEEHGLHLWLGFYENAFALMRECYDELGRDPGTCPIATWQQAFEPAPDVAVVDRTPNGQWQPWLAHFPPGHGLPGDPWNHSTAFSVRGYLVQAAGLLVELLRSAHAAPERPFRYSNRDPARLIDAAGTILRFGRLATVAAVIEAAQLVAIMLDVLGPLPRQATRLLPLLDEITAAGRRQLFALADHDLATRRIWQVIDIILAILRGSITSGLAVDPRGFDAINDHEWLDWLHMHGASPRSLDSGFVRGIYDLVFAYEGGDTSRPRLAAGVALRGSMRMFFTYRGALFWRMTAGMGDIVFAPLYEVCKRRGVRFEFFHRLRNVGLAPHVPDRTPYVERLEFDVQARLAGADYQPLVNVRGLPCWPSEPDYQQLQDGDRIRDEGWAFETPSERRTVGTRVLRVREDFDFVVIGLGIAALPEVCSELLVRSHRWRAMCRHGETTATQAFQLWMREDSQQLGWRHPPINLSGFAATFDTWADMSHLIPRENWSAPVASIAYFVSALPDLSGDPTQRVRSNAVHFLNNDVGALWPNATDSPGQFRWQVLACAHPNDESSEGPARFDTQFWKANTDPSDRYSLSTPGSIAYRLSPLDMSFDNLTIAGDWTQTGLDSGCVESAVMSGLLAAHAISHSPPLETIIGYDHP
jgi:uncharacterized protein with NAD-binding domain and iron-sulfur cluster